MRRGRSGSHTFRESRRAPRRGGANGIVAVEAGAPGFNAFAWGAVAVRAGTPEPIVAELDRMFRLTARHPEVLANPEAQGMQPMHAGPQKMRQLQVEEIVRLQRLAAATGLSMQ